jgi:hypothetical protein
MNRGDARLVDEPGDSQRVVSLEPLVAGFPGHPELPANIGKSLVRVATGQQKTHALIH